MSLGVRVNRAAGFDAPQAATLAQIVDDPSLSPLLQAAALDDAAPRGLARWPHHLEVSAEVVLGATRDLTAFVPRLAPTSCIAARQRDAQARATAAMHKLTQIVAGREGDAMDAWNALRPQVHKLLTDFPVLLAHVENATGSWPRSLYRWPAMTRAPRDVVIAGLLHAAQTHSAAFPMEADDACGLARDWDLAGTVAMRLMEGAVGQLRCLSPFQNSPVTAEVLQHFLETGALPPTELPVAMALLTPGDEVVRFETHHPGPWWMAGFGGSSTVHEVTLPFEAHGTDARTRQFLAAVFAGRCVPPVLRAWLMEDCRIVVQVRNAAFLHDVADKVVRLVSFDNTTHLYALVKAILRDGERALGAGAVIDGEPLYAFLARAPVMHVVSDNAMLAAFINDALAEDTPHMRRLRVALTLLEVQKLHYFDNADIKEAATDLLKGAEVGTLYELVSETLLQGDTGAPFYKNALWYANILGAGLIDYVDNRYGREAAAKLSLRSRGKRVTAETLHGPNADPEVVSAMQGAARASLWGAALGTVLQFGPMIPMSDPKAPVWQLMLGSSFGTLATSLSIPVDVLQQLSKKLRAHRALYEANIVRAPADDTEASRFSAMVDDAIRDITSSIEGQSSVTAFTLAPTIALLWLLLYPNPGAREMLQPVIFGLGPGFENLLTLVMAKVVKNGFQAAGADFETVAYAECVAHALAPAHAAGDPTSYADHYDAATRHSWAVNTMHVLTGPLRWLPAYRNAALASCGDNAAVSEETPLLANE